MHQWDVKSAFPNAKLQEKVYIQQPIGLEDPEKPDWVCLLDKALYGLKQSAREWENLLKDLLKALGFNPLKTEQSIYIREDKSIILIAYIDDIIVITLKIEDISELFNKLAKSIDLKNIGEINEFLGIEITRNRQKRTISLNQSRYTEKILSKYGYKDKKSLIKTSPIPIGAKIEPLQDTATLEDIKAFQ